MVYRSPERSPQDSRDRFFWYSAQAPFSWPRVDLARPLRRACSRSFGFISFEFVKVCGIRFSICESFIGFISAAILFILCWHVYLPLEFEKVVLKGSMAAKMASRVSYLVYYYFIQSEFKQIITKFRWSIKNNNNCRVSFIDLYLVFSRNFRIAFLPHTNIVILLEPYCGTITEPRLPVVGLSRLCSATFGVWSNFFRFQQPRANFVFLNNF